MSAGVVAGAYHGGGHLVIAPGALVCELGPVARRIAGFERLVHSHTSVHVFKARLVPFWFNVTVVIDDGRDSVLASKSAFALKMLVGSLRQAGFDVSVHKTWTDRGRSLGAPN